MATTATPQVSKADIADYHRLKQQIAELEEKASAIRAAILASFDPDKYRVEVDGVKYDVDVTYARGSLNTKLFSRDYPVSKNAALYKKVPNNEAILEELGEDASRYFGVTQRLTVKVSA